MPQRACLLSPEAPAAGYISTSNDEDYFRFEVLDFGVTVGLELVSSPYPYRVSVHDWEGETITATGDVPPGNMARSLQFRAPAPGSYYAIVDALYDDEISSTEPYRLVYRPQYPGPVPHIAYSADFRQPSLEFSGTKEWGRYYTEEGKYHVDLGRGGSVDTVAVAVAWWGEPYTDFTMVTDIKLNAIGERAGFAIGFRGQPRPAGEVLADDQPDLQSAYLLLASTHDLRMTLLRLVDNKTDVLVPWTQVRSMRTSNGTNHVVIRSAGSHHIVNINGEEIVKFADERLHGGQFVLGALSYGEPVGVVFDNLLVTTPR